MPEVVDPIAVRDLLTRTTARRHRLFVHLVGGADWAKQLLDGLFPALTPTWLHQLNRKQLLNLLGTETDCLVLDAWQGFNPNALGIASPTLKAGGVMVLITPPDAQWVDYADPDYQRMLSVDNRVEQISGRFIRHTLSRLCESSAVLHIDQKTGVQWPNDSHEGVLSNVPNLSDQAALIDDIKRVATGHGRRPLVITADRGRGKSAALGLAAAGLLLDASQAAHPMHLLITAPVFSAVECSFRHCAQALGLDYQGEREFRVDGGSFRFVPIDQLLTEKPDANLLLVDEAAAISTTQLQSISDHWNRLVFSTTVFGYEGNGRGFAIRFSQNLKASFPQTRFRSLVEPIRFAADDPLERLVNRMLLLEDWSDATWQAQNGVQCIDRDQLLEAPAFLEAVFGLLVEAHYQTSPDDLRILLDHPDVELWVNLKQGRPVAVAILMAEGGLSTEAVAAIEQGHRRYRGHIMPQALTDSGHEGMLSSRYIRVMRIAVGESDRRRGYAQQLLSGIASNLIERGVDYLGASFSAETSVFDFWLSSGFVPVRLGVRRDSATGEYSVVVLRALSDVAVETLSVVRLRYQSLLPYQLLTQNQDITPKLIAGLFSNAVTGLSAADSSRFDVIGGTTLNQALLQGRAWLKAQRSLEAVKPDLMYLLIGGLKKGGAVVGDTQGCPALASAEDLAIRYLLLNQSMSVIVAQTPCTGRKQFEQSLRDYFSGIVAFFENNKPLS